MSFWRFGRWPSMPLPYPCPSILKCQPSTDYIPSPPLLGKQIPWCLFETRLSERGSWCDVTSSLSPGVARLLFKLCTWEEILQKAEERFDFLYKLADELLKWFFLWCSIENKGHFGAEFKAASGGKMIQVKTRSRRILVSGNCALQCLFSLSDCRTLNKPIVVIYCYIFLRF